VLADVLAAGRPDDPVPEREAADQIAGDDEGKLGYLDKLATWR
jgi:hypothetical protein